MPGFEFGNALLYQFNILAARMVRIFFERMQRPNYIANCRRHYDTVSLTF
jgi:hypothetical protein